MFLSKAWSEQKQHANALFKSAARVIALRRLENELASILRTVSGHRKNKLPQGASQFRILWQKADVQVFKFCTDYDVPRQEIESQVPALSELRALAQSPARPKTKMIALSVLISGTVAIFLMGFATGLIQHLFTYGFNSAQWVLHLL